MLHITVGARAHAAYFEFQVALLRGAQALRADVIGYVIGESCDWLNVMDHVSNQGARWLRAIFYLQRA